MEIKGYFSRNFTRSYVLKFKNKSWPQPITAPENFKSVQRFIDFHENGELSTPEQVAEKIYYLDVTGEFKNGRILDIRNI